MELELHPSTVEWILQQMESLTKQVMTSSLPEDTHYKAEKIGKFTAYKDLLTNSGYESYGIEFKIKLPTNAEYAKS